MKRKAYTLADLESVTAVTAEFFWNSKRAQKFYDAEHTDSGIVGVWQYLRDAALILEREAAAFGTAGEDYDWLQTVQEFAHSLYAYKSAASEIAFEARECLRNNRYV